MTAARAVALVVEARARGLDITLRDGRVRVAGEGDAPADLLDRLRAERPDVVRVLAGDACVYCGERVPWPNAEAVVFATGEGAHLSCYERHLCRHPSYWRARDLDPTERKAVADEGEFDHGNLEPAVIAEARTLAGITKVAKECAEDLQRCDYGGRCCWGFR